MKKVLLSFLIILLGVLIYVVVFRDIYLGNWNNTNIYDLQEHNNRLTATINTAREKNEQIYGTKIEQLSQSIKNLDITKETYDSKVKYITEETELGIVQIKEYKIEYLWTILENYAKDEKIKLKLDLVENGNDNLYDLNITLTGTYIGITDFIYDIEKDDSFDFKIENYKMEPRTVQTTTDTNNNNNNSNNNSNSNSNNTNSNNSAENTNKVVNTQVIQATFNIKNVRIELD